MYNVLAGLLLRDVFPDFDALCGYLKCDQFSAVSWFLELVAMSLEMVEYHLVVEEQAGLGRRCWVLCGSEKIEISSVSFLLL